MREMKLRVLEAVDNHWGKARFGPTVEEIRVEVGLQARSSVQFHINSLLDDGLLIHVPLKHRTLRTSDKGKRLVRKMRGDVVDSEGEE